MSGNSAGWKFNRNSKIIPYKEVDERLAELADGRLLEFKALSEIRRLMQTSLNWGQGIPVVMLREDTFDDYVRMFIDEEHDVNKEFPGDVPWPFNHMTFHYEAAIKEFRDGCFVVPFDGANYLVRS
jgi:hypothetical protein